MINCHALVSGSGRTARICLSCFYIGMEPAGNSGIGLDCTMMKQSAKVAFHPPCRPAPAPLISPPWRASFSGRMAAFQAAYRGFGSHRKALDTGSAYHFIIQGLPVPRVAYRGRHRHSVGDSFLMRAVHLLPVELSIVTLCSPPKAEPAHGPATDNEVVSAWKQTSNHGVANSHQRQPCSSTAGHVPLTQTSCCLICLVISYNLPTWMYKNCQHRRTQPPIVYSGSH